VCRTDRGTTAQQHKQAAEAPETGQQASFVLRKIPNAIESIAFFHCHWFHFMPSPLTCIQNHRYWRPPGGRNSNLPVAVVRALPFHSPIHARNRALPCRAVVLLARSSAFQQKESARQQQGAGLAQLLDTRARQPARREPPGRRVTQVTGCCRNDSQQDECDDRFRYLDCRPGPQARAVG
jgi:hypothetical protein